MENEPARGEGLGYNECLDRALQIQFAAAQSVAGLRRKLAWRGFESDIIERVLAELIKVGELNDTRFAQSRVKRKLSKGYGPWAMRNELREKGVERELGEEVVGEVSEEDLISHAVLVVKLYEPKRGEHPAHFRNRRKAALARRGFSFEVIRKAEERVENPEENE